MPKRAKPHRPPGARAKPAHEERRPSAHQRGYNRQWQRFSRAYLRQHPLCAECRRQGRLVPATVVDHVTPHRGDPVAFWAGPFQGLCLSCHAKKTRRGE